MLHCLTEKRGRGTGGPIKSRRKRPICDKLKGDFVLGGKGSKRSVIKKKSGEANSSWIEKNKGRAPDEQSGRIKDSCHLMKNERRRRIHANEIRRDASVVEYLKNREKGHEKDQIWWRTKGG